MNGYLLHHVSRQEPFRKGYGSQVDDTRGSLAARIARRVLISHTGALVTGSTAPSGSGLRHVEHDDPPRGGIGQVLCKSESGHERRYALSLEPPKFNSQEGTVETVLSPTGPNPSAIAIAVSGLLLPLGVLFSFVAQIVLGPFLHHHVMIFSGYLRRKRGVSPLRHMSIQRWDGPAGASPNGR